MSPKRSCVRASGAISPCSVHDNSDSMRSIAACSAASSAAISATGGGGRSVRSRLASMRRARS